ANGVFRENYRLAWPPLRGLIVDQRAFALPPDLPAGKAAFEVGLYTRRAGEPYSQAKRVPLVDANGNAGGDQVVVAPVMIGADAAAGMPSAPDMAGMTATDAVFGERIALAGWQIARSDDAQGATVRLCWTARHRVPENPTSRWVPGETVCSEHPLTLPDDAAQTRLRVGLYEPVSGRQWGVSAASAVPGQTYLILDPWAAP
ncbi:MAG: hypothetical protein MUC34_21460, partial [Anaerolineae bacterium]|nr:hypothetical protein [Anaerolineae bacterium]